MAQAQRDSRKRRGSRSRGEMRDQGFQIAPFQTRPIVNILYVGQLDALIQCMVTSTSAKVVAEGRVHWGRGKQEAGDVD